MVIIGQLISKKKLTHSIYSDFYLIKKLLHTITATHIWSANEYTYLISNTYMHEEICTLISQHIQSSSVHLSSMKMNKKSDVEQKLFKKKERNVINFTVNCNGDAFSSLHSTANNKNTFTYYMHRNCRHFCRNNQLGNAKKNCLQYIFVFSFLKQ